MKNRIDESSKYHPISLDELKALPSPQGKLNKPRAAWTAEQKKIVERNEGIPIVVHAYFLLTSIKGVSSAAKPEAPEECNCWKTERSYVDFRLWLVNGVDSSKSEAIVAEMTPRVRAHHRQWTLENLTRLAQERFLVRVYGWLMFEEDEQPQVGLNRVTLWEIHPIIQIEFREKGVWKTL